MPQRVYVNREKGFCAVYFNSMKNWTFHKMTKSGEVHYGFAPAHCFTPTFSEACTKARTQSTAIPASGWTKHSIDSSAKSVDELFREAFKL